MSCVAHVINLVIQEGLRCIEIVKVFTVERMTNLIDEDELLMFSTTFACIGEIVYQVRQLVSIVWSSTQRYEHYVFCR